MRYWRRDGVTIVEMLITLSVFVIVGTLLLSILVSNTGLSYKQSAKVTQGVGVNDVISSITTNIKQSSSVATGYPENQPSYTTDGSNLVLELPAVDSSGDSISGAFDYAIYYRDGDKVRFKVFPSDSPKSSRFNEDRILTFNATSLSFQYFDGLGAEVTPSSAVKVKVMVTLTQNIGAGDQTNTASAETELRND